jgi:hypothetical protein
MLICSAVSASSAGFICQNPGREYYLVYEPGAKFLVVDPDSHNTQMKILVDENTDSRHIVTAETVKDGPIARLHLRPYQKLEYWDDGEVVQTDGCYKSK